MSSGLGDREDREGHSVILPWGQQVDGGSVVAWVALFLSQAPPLWKLVRGKKLVLKVAESARASQVFGVFTVAFWLELHNSGGRALTIERVECELEHNGKTLVLDGKEHWLTGRLGTGNEVSIPSGSFRLARGGSWSGYVQFWSGASYSKAFQKKVRDLTKLMRDDLQPKLEQERAKAAAEQREVSLVTLSKDLVNQGKQLITEKMEVELGDYIIRVRAFEHGSNKAIATATYYMTLFENDVADLLVELDDIQYGGGWVYPSTSKQWVSITVRTSS